MTIDHAELRRLCLEAIHHPDSIVRRERDEEIGQDAVTTILDLLDAMEAEEAQKRKLREALEPFAERGRDLTDFTCHVGITSAHECSRCGPVLRARAALAETTPMEKTT